MRVEIDASQVHHPGEGGGVVDHHLVRRAARWKRQLDGAHELGHRLRRPLLEEGLARRSVDEALERHWPIPHAKQRAIGDGEVVAHELDLGDPGLGEEHLARVADRDLVPVEDEALRLGARHRRQG
jgi:hypothetical protein